MVSILIFEVGDPDTDGFFQEINLRPLILLDLMILLLCRVDLDWGHFLDNQTLTFSVNLVSESLKNPLNPESMSELQLFIVNLVFRISDWRRLASVNMCSENDFKDMKS